VQNLTTSLDSLNDSSLLRLFSLTTMAKDFNYLSQARQTGMPLPTDYGDDVPGRYLFGILTSRVAGLSCSVSLI
jgi:hypothetical protein